MILTIDGNLKPYYAQTLCMSFFPGVKFPEGEQPGENVPSAHFIVREEDDGAFAEATLELNGKSEHMESRCSVKPGIDRTRARQIAAGCAFFEAASALTGVRPHWGVLTGVRPAKIASELFRYGYNPEEAAAWITEHYLADPVKSKLAASVAAAEQRLITSPLSQQCSVYIAIPFCPTRCAYCSFVSYTSKKLLDLIPEYLQALEKNIRTVFETIRSLGRTVATVYIGGGTPTTLSGKQLRKLLSTVASCTDVTALDEFTLEAGRPDTITADKLRIAAEFGVTRVSVNPQTLADDVLENIGRKHTADGFFKAYALAEKSGIRDINTDLIVGLPGDSFKKFSASLERIIELAPSNITVHTFCFKRAAALSDKNSEPFVPDAPSAAKCIQYSQLMLANAGYKPYYMYRQKNAVGNLENVGYARQGSECMYNIYMMEELHSIFGAGAGAVTKLVEFDEKGERRMQRIFAPKYPYEYVRDFDTVLSTYPEKVFAFFDIT